MPATFLKDVVRGLSRGNHLVIYSPEYTGKTAFAKEVEKYYDNQGNTVCVTMDSHPCGQPNMLHSLIARKVKQGVGHFNNDSVIHDYFLTNNLVLVLIIDNIDKVQDDLCGRMLCHVSDLINNQNAASQYWLSVCLLSSINLRDALARCTSELNDAGVIRLPLMRQEKVVAIASSKGRDGQYGEDLYNLTEGHPEVVNIILESNIHKLSSADLELLFTQYSQQGILKNIVYEIRVSRKFFDIIVGILSCGSISYQEGLPPMYSSMEKTGAIKLKNGKWFFANSFFELFIRYYFDKNSLVFFNLIHGYLDEAFRLHQSAPPPGPAPEITKEIIRNVPKIFDAAFTSECFSQALFRFYVCLSLFSGIHVDDGTDTFEHGKVDKQYLEVFRNAPDKTYPSDSVFYCKYHLHDAQIIVALTITNIFVTKPLLDEIHEHVMKALAGKVEVGGPRNRARLLNRLGDTLAKLDSMNKHVAFLCIDVVSSAPMKKGEKKPDIELTFIKYKKYVIERMNANGALKSTFTSDGAMICFSTADEAVKTAKEILNELDMFNETMKLIKTDFKVRCGVNAGVVSFDEVISMEDMCDHVIDVAGHMQKDAPHNGICISKVALDLLMKEGEGFIPLNKFIDGHEVYVWEKPT